MEKLGVLTTRDQERMEKLASQGCPVCGSTPVLHGTVLVCPRCGSEPFEDTDDKNR